MGKGDMKLMQGVSAEVAVGMEEKEALGTRHQGKAQRRDRR
jgi:hypothetical protein